jgi:hypothetical protein
VWRPRHSLAQLEVGDGVLYDRRVDTVPLLCIASNQSIKTYIVNLAGPPLTNVQSWPGHRM